MAEGGHECPSVHGPLRRHGLRPAAPPCSGPKRGQWGQSWVPPGGGGTRTEPPRAGTDEAPAALTGRGGLGGHLVPAARARLHLAVDGRGVVSLPENGGETPPSLSPGGRGRSPPSWDKPPPPPWGRGGPSMSPRGISPVKQKELGSDAGNHFQGRGPPLRGLWGHRRDPQPAAPGGEGLGAGARLNSPSLTRFSAPGGLLLWISAYDGAGGASSLEGEAGAAVERG